jgi:hypothetical protein
MHTHGNAARRRRGVRGSLALLAGLGVLGACGSDLNVPEYNNPSLEDLENNPTPAGVKAAATGLLIGARADLTGRTGYIPMLGIVGREAYILDASDPRYINELLVGPLTNTGAFGAGIWTSRYANIRGANILLTATGKVAGFTDAQKEAIRGFAKTIQALDFLLVVNSRDVNGAPIDVNRPIDDLAPLESKAEVLARVAQLLDEGRAHLAAAGATAFPFNLSTGFAGFGTPATFIQLNRALRARVDVYRADYASAITSLGASFVSTGSPLTTGAYHTYGTGSDASNELATNLIYAHPSIVTDAELKPDLTVDNRVTAKVGPHPQPRTAFGVSSDKAFLLYPQPASRVPIIRNEELILLRSEARWFTGDKPGAMADLNFIRTTSGGLAAIAQPATDADYVTELLKQRRYSLLFEGHRWIDVRRFGRLASLPLDQPTHTRVAAFQIPASECQARNLTSPCTGS